MRSLRYLRTMFFALLAALATLGGSAAPALADDAVAAVGAVAVATDDCAAAAVGAAAATDGAAAAVGAVAVACGD